MFYWWLIGVVQYMLLIVTITYDTPFTSWHVYMAVCFVLLMVVGVWRGGGVIIHNINSANGYSSGDTRHFVTRQTYYT